MGSSEHTGARLVRDPPSRKDEERLFGARGGTEGLKSPQS